MSIIDLNQCLAYHEYVPPAASTHAASKGERAELLELMHQVGDRMRRRYSEVIGEFGLTPPLVMMLKQLEGPAPMGALAERLCLDASSVTGMTDRLEALGMVERRPDPTDRRVKQVVITETGLETRSRIYALLKASPVFPELDGDDVTALIGLLRKVLAD